jgi:hypothetical protein
MFEFGIWVSKNGLDLYAKNPRSLTIVVRKPVKVVAVDNSIHDFRNDMAIPGFESLHLRNANSAGAISGFACKGLNSRPSPCFTRLLKLE